MLRVFHPALPCTHWCSERQVELAVGFNRVGGAKDPLGHVTGTWSTFIGWLVANMIRVLNCSECNNMESPSI